MKGKVKRKAPKRDFLLQIITEGSSSDSIIESCKKAGVHRCTFYYFMQTDLNFRLAVLEIEKQRLENQIADTKAEIEGLNK